MAEQVTVHQALSKVMGDVQAVKKDSKNQAQRFNFRGIDAVMNAVGPALRKHGVTILPEDVEVHRSNGTTASGKQTAEVIVKVTYRVYGPAGDSIHGKVAAEAMDFGDKAIAKAMSVAYRTFLLQALTIPTDEPDPDSESYERGVPSGTGTSQRNRGFPREQRPSSAEPSLTGSAPLTTWTATRCARSTSQQEARPTRTCSGRGWHRTTGQGRSSEQGERTPQGGHRGAHCQGGLPGEEEGPQGT
nr:MAG TPA: ERF superfamily protein [Caudoviricetes sp.]